MALKMILFSVTLLSFFMCHFLTYQVQHILTLKINKNESPKSTYAHTFQTPAPNGIVILLMCKII